MSLHSSETHACHMGTAIHIMWLSGISAGADCVRLHFCSLAAEGTSVACWLKNSDVRDGGLTGFKGDLS